MLLMEPRTAPRRADDNAEPTDAELVARVLDGDAGAFTVVVRRHDDRLRALAYKLLGGDRHRMDDVMQDAYLRAYRALGSFRLDSHLGSWLYRIVYNACIDELRRSKRRPAPVDVRDAAWDRPSTAAGPERAATNADAALRALAALPDDQRITVVMVDGEGLDNQTAARLLDVAPGTVASRLSRARAAMRHHLGRPTHD
jgi:RNA polymerase sigma-70 factor (ECF subfamily)